MSAGKIGLGRVPGFGFGVGCLGFVFFSLVVASFAQDPAARYDAIKKVYETKLKEAEAKETAAMKGAIMDYALALEGIKSRAQSVGDLDGVLAAKEEQERLVDGTLDDAASVGEAMKPSRVQYDTASRKVLEEKATFLRKLDASYTAELEKLVVSLTQAGNIELAKDVKEEREWILDTYKGAGGVVPPPPGTIASVRLASVKMPEFQRMHVEKGARIVLDKEVTFEDVPDSIKGLEFLQTRSDRDQRYILTVTTTGKAYMLARDERKTNELMESKGWLPTGDHVRLRGRDVRMKVYERVLPAGLKLGVSPVEKGMYPRLLCVRRIAAW